MKLLRRIAPPAVLFLFLLFGNSFALASFSDISSSHDNSDAINYMQSENIVQGYNDGTFKPDQTINRAEFTKIIMEAITDKPLTDANCFSDVKNEWFAPYVCNAKISNFIDGYADGSFKPAQEINFAEAAKIIVNTFGYPVGSDTIWYKPYVSALSEKSAIPTSIKNFDKKITRGDMAEMIYRLRASVTTKTSNTYEALAGEKRTEALRINSIGKTSAMPMTLLEISGTGFNTNSEVVVRFFIDKDFSVDIPLLELTYHSLKVAVPPVIINGELAGGDASVQLVVKSGDHTLISNTKPLKIEELPTTESPAGTITLAFLNGAVTYARDLQNEIKGTALDTKDLNASIGYQIANLDALAKEVENIKNNSDKTYQMGTFDNKTVTIGSKDLRNADRMILGMLLAQAEGISSVSLLDQLLGIHTAFASGGCQAAEARSFADQINAGGQISAGTVSGYYGAANTSIGCKFADAFNTGYLVIGGAAAVATGLLALANAPAIALALPTAALLYVTITGAGGMIGIGGALGQDSDGARQLVQQGVEQIESQFRGMIIGQVLPKFSETADALRTIYEGGESLIEAFGQAGEEITEPEPESATELEPAPEPEPASEIEPAPEPEPVDCDELEDLAFATRQICMTNCDWRIQSPLDFADCVNICNGIWMESLDCP